MNSINNTFNNNNYDDDNDSIVIDTSISKRTKRNILCVICKQRLDNISENVWKCPKCKNDYFINSEIVEIEDDFSSSHADNETIELEGIDGINKPIILTVDDDFTSDNELNEKKSGFYSTNYLQGPGKTIIEETEEWPQNE